MEFLLAIGALLILGWAGFKLQKFGSERRDASAEREAALLAEFAAVRAAAQAQREGAALADTASAPKAEALATPVPFRKPAEVPPTPRPVDEPVAAPAAPVRGRLYLGRAHAIAYRLLRIALPEREVFARSSLKAVLGVEAVGKDLRVDFVVCDRATRILAVVDLVREDELAPVVELKKVKLEESGIRYLRWSAEALPDRDSVARLFGAGAVAGG